MSLDTSQNVSLGLQRCINTLVEYLDEPHLADYSERPWSKGSNPLTAVNKFLAANSSFHNIDFIDNKLICSGAINGWLRKSS